MEIMEELSGSTSNDLSLVINKGKRTKRRQRPVSAAVTSSSSSGGVFGAGGGGGGGEDGEILGYFYPFVPSSTSEISATSTDHHHHDDDEDDQVDIANCLILLAQGDQISKKPDYDHGEKLISSKRFNEMATSTAGGKVGFFVYECKTCNRTFPSFQALGGHRASHKKPKVSVSVSIPEDKKTATQPLLPPTNDHHHHQEEFEEVIVKEEQAQELLLPSNKCLERINISSTNNKSKNHECSICGAEFSSGQALGGHMRRHRNPPPMTAAAAGGATATNKVSSMIDEASSHVVAKKPRNNNVFTLDLNLPAPLEEDHHHNHRDSKFQQHHLVFSAPALVDCHY